MQRKDYFISYTAADRPWAEWIAWQLEQAGFSTVLQAWDFRPGQDFVLAMQAAAVGSHRTLAVLSPRYLTSAFTPSEWAAALARDPLGNDRLLIPVRIAVCQPEGLLGQRISIDLVDLPEAEAREALIRGLLPADRPAAPPAFPGPSPGFPGAGPAGGPGAGPAGGPAGAWRDGGPIPGMAAREVVFDRDRPLPGRVFALELLTQPLILARDERGRISVTVQRDQVSHALYRTEAKKALCDRVLAGGESLAAALAIDREVHAFLSGRGEEDDLLVPLDDLPLRWSSGGVMSVVGWRGRHWVPFFFRDIEPCGWNISLGGSDLGDDLDDPWTFLLREFLEEMLVVDGEPRRGRPVCHRPFEFERLDAGLEKAKAARFARQHIEARSRQDGLIVHAPLRGIAVDFARTRTAVRIERGGQGRVHNNVLVCINPLELGIEVVKVLEYDLDEQDVLLDGEILVLPGSEELVRMPVGLISLDYLQATFSDLTELSYVGRTQPSIAGPPIPPGEIRIFPFDVERRRRIALGQEPRATAWERESYRAWLDRFGASFFDAEGRVDPARAPALFTPSSAKIVSYFFANRR